ncbi:MAG: MoaD/ThiS family protein [Desulfobacterales bacterium]|nr:MoaD/ThiS family protein [Desulfobacterales bacterium]
MNIRLKCFATLSESDHCHFDDATSHQLPRGHNVAGLLKQVGIAAEAVKIVFVNSRIAALDTILQDGDNVALSPAVGGM